jgi:hypothetical protein
MTSIATPVKILRCEAAQYAALNAQTARQSIPIRLILSAPGQTHTHGLPGRLFLFWEAWNVVSRDSIDEALNNFEDHREHQQLAGEPVRQEARPVRRKAKVSSSTRRHIEHCQMRVTVSIGRPGPNVIPHKSVTCSGPAYAAASRPAVDL